MTLKLYLTIMSITTLICWLAFGFVLNSIDPYVTNWVGFLLFYVSLFLSIAGASAIIGFLIRFIALKHELVFNSVKNAFRQSFFFAFLIMAALILLSKCLFTWGNLLLLVLGLSVLEYFMISYGSRNA